MEGARDVLVLVQPCRLGEVEYNNPFNGWGEMGNRGFFFFFFWILLRRVVVVEKRFAVVRVTTRRAAHVINRVGGVLPQ